MAAWGVRAPLSEYAILYANGRVFSCMSLGVEKGRPLFEFGGISIDDRSVMLPTGTATKAGERMIQSGWPRLVDNPDAMEVLDAVAAGDLSVLDWEQDPDFDPFDPKHEARVYPEPGIPPPEYDRPWTLATDPTELAVIYDDGGIVTIWAHRVETTATHYRFHVTLDDDADVIMGTATRPGALCLLTGTPALADNSDATAILTAAHRGDLAPARAAGPPSGATGHAAG